MQPFFFNKLLATIKMYAVFPVKIKENTYNAFSEQNGNFIKKQEFIFL